MQITNRFTFYIFLQVNYALVTLIDFPLQKTGEPEVVL